jgi:prepilin-type N-terminal cleavage/methylation domain-containing protein
MQATGRQFRRGMTLIELTLAVTIMAMVLAGVATIAFALTSVKSTTDDTSSKQAYVRYAQTQVADLVRDARLVCYSSDSQVVLWAADTNSDGLMNVTEMALLATNNASSAITLTHFVSTANPHVTLSTIGDQAGQWWLGYGATASTITVVPECTNATFATDVAAPASTYVSLTFSLLQDKEVISYSVCGNLRARAAYSLSSTDIVSDDD